MDRRNIFKTALAAGAGLFAARAAGPARADPAGSAEVTPKVVYHLADLEKVMFVLGSIRHHFEGMGGPEKVKIALVVHGNALWAFRGDTPNIALKEHLRDMVGAHLDLHACAHTMERMRLNLDGLVPGFAVAEKGGVVKLAELQGQGYAYLRP